MKNSTAPVAFENTLLKKTDHLLLLDVVYKEGDHSVKTRAAPLEKKSNQYFKRVMDIFISSLLIIFLFSWMLPLIALLIRLDSKGPVFFLQKRNKKFNLIFTCIKFRTMIPNQAADILPAVDNDARITRLGSFLRKYYLDELPQLLNVLWGDMSMIGPRPYMLSDNLKYGEVVQDYTLRHTVKPGITGPAQLLGYGGAIMDPAMITKRVHMDFLYVQNWSIWLDIEILLRTFLKTFSWGKPMPAIFAGRNYE